MAKKVEVTASEYDWLKQTLKDYAYTIAILDVENLKLKQELDEVKKERDALIQEANNQ